MCSLHLNHNIIYNIDMDKHTITLIVAIVSFTTREDKTVHITIKSKMSFD